MKDVADIIIMLGLSLAIAVAWFAICRHTGILVGLS